ncbi:hypothetical protein BN1013_01612 [Candidatus Rubidus massiliensis]|nr:hypothetical protein BN1013_01612 [Candidatus Rubidus massiliensis]
MGKITIQTIELGICHANEERLKAKESSSKTMKLDELVID